MKYFNLWVSFLKISVMAELEYRLNMLVKILGDVLWYFTQLSVFEVLFYHAPQIAGWDIHSIRVFMGVLFAVDASYMIFFYDNFEQTATLVKKGELDFILAKPINSQFLFSFRKVNAVYFINLCMVFIYLGWGISQLNVQPEWYQYIGTCVLMIGGLCVLYSLRFFFAALNVLFVNATSLTYVWYQFYRLGNRPHALYPPWLRWVVLTIFPVALISSVPATNLVHGISPQLDIGALLFALFLLFLTTRFWKFVLKRYASASS